MNLVEPEQLINKTITKQLDTSFENLQGEEFYDPDCEEELYKKRSKRSVINEFSK